jgi:O-antigen/teichoic acid export membrane protein
VNVAVQAFGPASAFLTIFLIARLGGPSDQGEFAQLKAFVDLMVALGCFGFPQGFVFVINKLAASGAALARWSQVYALAFLPVAVGGALAAQRLGYLSIGGAERLSSVFLLTAAASVLVLHGMWRGVYLTHDQGIPFAVFTILPAVTQLLAVAAALFAGWRRFDWAILLATLPAIAATTAMMRPILAAPTRGRVSEQPWRPLLSNGLHSFLQAVLMTLQPMVAYGLVRYLGGGSADVGRLNAGLFLVQGLTVPITMVAPLLFARWTSVTDAGFVQRLRDLTWRGVAAGGAAGVILALAAAALVPLIFGARYGAAVRPAQAMLLTLPLACHVRVVAPALHARGRPGLNTVALALRLAAFAAAAIVLPRVTGEALTAVGIAWSLAEVAGACFTFVGLRYAADDEALRAAVGYP